MKSVDLSHNKIRHFHSDSFISTPLVDELKLSHNGLTEVSDVSFVMDALPKLRLLDLSKNDIRDIPFGALRGNFSYYIYYGPSMMSQRKTPWKDPEWSLQIVWGHFT